MSLIQVDWQSWGSLSRVSQGQRLLMMPVRKYRDLVIAELPLGKFEEVYECLMCKRT